MTFLKKIFKNKKGSGLVEKIMLTAFAVAAGGAVIVYTSNVVISAKDTNIPGVDTIQDASGVNNIGGTQYNVQFYNYDDSILWEITVSPDTVIQYGGPTPTRPAPANGGYYGFEGWVLHQEGHESNGHYFAKNTELPAITGNCYFTTSYSYTSPIIWF